MSRLLITELFFIILFSKFGSIDSDPSLFFHYCGANNTNNINLDSNLNKLFSNLTSKANSSNDGSATTIVNVGDPDQLNGLIMCYIDSQRDSCLQCLNFSVIEATKKCPGSSTATFTYDSCFLHYSTDNFIGSLTLYQPPNIYSNYIKLSSSTLNETVNELMDSLRQKAIISSNLLYANDSRTDPDLIIPVYGVVQCSKDLDQNSCGLCLDYAIANLSEYMSSNSLSVGTRLSFMSCYIRYELYSLSLLTFKSPSNAGSNETRSKLVAITVLSAFGAFFLFSLSGVCFWRRLWRKKISRSKEEETTSECIISSDCQVFLLSELKSATNNFSEDSKLGGGGFGSVYKGELHDRKEIAVKRLAVASTQGFVEFKTEVELLAKLKHRNLVKLLGYCMEKNEKLLCYEYLPSKSFDRILFATDTIKREKLRWQTRYRIIEGISSGLQYLHLESGYKIVHRDLKPSNILLDEDMNPKISDFGLARLYEDDQTHKETSKIAGTYGYMAPEYAMHGMYSEKSDVYSFGILLMEIVTGRKNSSFCNNLTASSIISYVGKHWAQGELEVLKDPVLEDECLTQLSRCIQIGLLCVQENPINRPNMDAVNFLLRNDSTDIPALPSLNMDGPDHLLSQYSISTTTTSNSGLMTGVSGDHSSSTEAAEKKSTDKATAMPDRC